MSDPKEKQPKSETSEKQATNPSKDLLAGFDLSLDDLLDQGISALDSPSKPTSQDLRLFDTPPPVTEQPSKQPTEQLSKQPTEQLSEQPDTVAHTPPPPTQPPEQPHKQPDTAAHTPPPPTQPPPEQPDEQPDTAAHTPPPPTQPPEQPRVQIKQPNAAMTTLDLGPEDVVASAMSTHELERQYIPPPPKPKSAVMTTINLGPEDILSQDSEDDVVVPNQIKLSLMDTIQTSQTAIRAPEQQPQEPVDTYKTDPEIETISARQQVAGSQDSILVMRGRGSSMELPEVSEEYESSASHVKVVRGRQAADSSEQLPAASPQDTQAVSQDDILAAVEQTTASADDTLQLKREEVLAAARSRTQEKILRTGRFVETLKLPPSAILAIAEAHTDALTGTLAEAPTAPGEYTEPPDDFDVSSEPIEAQDEARNEAQEAPVTTPQNTSQSRPDHPAMATLKLPPSAILAIAEAHADADAGDIVEAPTAPGEYKELQEIRDKITQAADSTSQTPDSSESEKETSEDNYPDEASPASKATDASDATEASELQEATSSSAESPETTAEPAPQEAEEESAAEPKTDTDAGEETQQTPVAHKRDDHEQSGYPDGLGGTVEPTLRTRSEQAEHTDELGEIVEPTLRTRSTPPESAAVEVEAAVSEDAAIPETRQDVVSETAQSSPPNSSKRPSTALQVGLALLAGTLLLALGVWFFVFSL